MARIFITGSSDGLGLEAARQLVAAGHRVVLHARNASRADDTLAALPESETVAIADIASLAGMRELAARMRDLGPFDAVIHNAGVYGGDTRQTTADGFERTFAVNVIAPYLMTLVVPRPSRLIYLSSSLHRQGDPSLADPMWREKSWSADQAYCDSKLFVTMLAKSFAERWPDSFVNAVDPGWIATNMGGSNAPGNVCEGAATQAWLAVSDDPAARVTGAYFRDKEQQEPASAVADAAARAALLDLLEQLTGEA